MNRAATVALAPLSGIYGIFVKARNALYRRGILRTQQVGVPVISIGNLTAGGTGKTPLVEWTARELASLGRTGLCPHTWLWPERSRRTGGRFKR